MKSTIKTAAAGLLFSIITFGIALAMVPQDDLKKNLLSDEGIWFQVFSDTDNGVLNLRSGVPGLSDLDDSLAPPTQFHHQLVGKHLI